MSYYYLYLIKFEDGRFYIGSRKSKVSAEKDVNYWGSPGKTIKHLWEMKKEKHILFESTDISIQDLREKEYEMIQEGWNKFGKDKCINKNAGGLNHLDLEVVKKSGKKCRDQKIGIHGWSHEKRSKESKKTWHSNKNNRGFMSWDEERVKEFREEQRKNRCKTYKFFDPDGNKVIVDDLPAFCEKNNLSYSSMRVIHQGRKDYNQFHHQGWSIVGPEKVKELIEQSKEDRYEDKVFYDPSGKQIIINCMSIFAKKHNLSAACLSLVYNGELLQHKGYSVLHPDEVVRKKKELKLQQSERNSKTIKLRNPNGNIVEITNLVGYCREHGLNARNMHNLLTGKAQSCKGWTSAEKNIKPNDIGCPGHFKFRNPEGKIVEIYNLEKYARENKLDPKPSRAAKGLSAVNRGRVRSWRGWTRVEETEQNSSDNLIQFFE
jgi:hypothetical protein|tara:strand:+ start:57 stop:1355 length:1299 start_codon:yes stop_codon:yes gene_type:complete